MKTVKTTCPYCGVGCGVIASSDGTIKGDSDHPANFGRLCSKGATLGETIGLEERLLSPKSGGTDTDWDTALDLVANTFSQAIAEHGPDSVAFYVSGQLLTEDYYVANKLMKGYIGSANIDTNSRLCMASSVAGHKRAFGTDTVPGTYEDLEEADLVVLVGSNLAWCHPVLYQRLSVAKSQRPGMRVVNIDPRRTATCDLADLFLQIKSDTDIDLFNGLLAYLVDNNFVDLNYVHRAVSGCRSAVDQARQSDPLATGLDPKQIQEFFRLWSGSTKVVTVYSQGVNQSSCGTDKVNAIINCHLATGRLGRPGAGPFSVTGQPNAMGGREVGGLANMLANHLDLENADHREAVQTFWQSPRIADRAGLKAVDLFKACQDGRIKALWIMSTNPAVSMPNAAHVADAIAKVPFVVVSDIAENTDTGELADVLLPASGWGEKNGTVTNSERRLSRQRAFLDAPEHTRPDWRIICDVAKRMGWEQGFNFENPAEIFAEYVSLSDHVSQFGKDLDLSAFADIDYETFAPTQWPRQNHRFFANGKFYHSDGKARMVPVHSPVLGEQDYKLNTGRIRDQWHTMSRTGKAPRLGSHLAEPYLEINPSDAEQLKLGDASLAQVSCEGRDTILRVLITDRVVPGHVFAPIHWTRQRGPKSVINEVVSCGIDPVSGQPALKSASVQIDRFEARWFGYLVSSSRPSVDLAYSAVARTSSGWQCEMADDTYPSDWIRFVERLSGLRGCNTADFSDPGSGAVRVALTRDGLIEALFFAASEPVSLSRSHVMSLIGAELDPLDALPGRSSQDKPDPGPTICACFEVGRNTLQKHIHAGVVSVEDLGTKTCAGTNCGSCKPELAALIASQTVPMAAE